MKPHGMVIQGVDMPYVVFENVENRQYRGLFLYEHDPLFREKDPVSKALSKEYQWEPVNVDGEDRFLWKQCVFDPTLAVRYVARCKEIGKPVRVLFLESDYPDEEWQGEIPEKRLLGYEVFLLPWGVMVYHDLLFSPLLREYRKKLNENFLFATLEEAQSFMSFYKEQLIAGAVGDDDGPEDVFVAAVYEVDEKSFDAWSKTV